MAVKKSTNTRSRVAPQKTNIKARFNAGRIQFLFLGLAIASLVGGLGYNLLNQSEAATLKCRFQTLRVGASGGCVRTLQTVIYVNTDGKFGSQTKAKVMAFQRANNIKADGVVGSTTWTTICFTLNSSRRQQAYLWTTIGCNYRNGRYSYEAAENIIRPYEGYIRRTPIVSVG